MRDEQQLEQMLSAYLDGELTQADQQRVRVWLEDSGEARERFEQMRQIQQITASMSFVPPPDDRIDELTRRLSVQAPRSIGWVFLLLGVVVLAAFAAGQFWRAPDVPWPVKLGSGGVAGGFLFLLGSVARQRWLEHPHDRYRGVRR